MSMTAIFGILKAFITAILSVIGGIVIFSLTYSLWTHIQASRKIIKRWWIKKGKYMILILGLVFIGILFASCAPVAKPSANPITYNFNDNSQVIFAGNGASVNASPTNTSTQTAPDINQTTEQTSNDKSLLAAVIGIGVIVAIFLYFYIRWRKKNAK